ncbi:MAG TPA: tyrosine-type recombinase/integrase [Gemmatales bacterium]|nr:tyrosine-type recombinase/integrase [Gemmatales bacterium]
MAQIRRKKYTDKQTDTVKERPKWYIRYRAGNGKIREVPGYTDRRATERKAAKLEAQAEREMEGLAPSPDTCERIPLAQHLDDFESYLVSKGGVEGHAHHVAQRVRKLVEGCGFKLMADLRLSKVQSFISTLTFKKCGSNAVERPATLQTKNYYVAAARHFASWLVRDGRLTSNPLVGLVRYNTANCPRRDDRKRRALSIPEFYKVFETTLASPKVFRKLTGQDRAMLYACAVGTGFRASELASLNPEDFKFDTSPATVRLRASETKDRKEVEQPILQGVAERLRDYINTKPHGSPVWPGTWRERIFKATRADLAAAGIPARTSEGVFDFHGWRHSYITYLVTSGMNPKQAQSLARHSDIRLTMNRYAHLSQQERMDATHATTLDGRASPPTSPLGG